MKKDFKIFLIISIFIHIGIGAFSYKMLFREKITFNKEETKIVNIQLVKNFKKNTAISHDKTNTPSYSKGMKNSIKQNVKIGFKTLAVYQGVNTEEKSHDLKNNIEKLKLHTPTPDIFKDENIIEPQWSQPQIDNGLSFSDGNSRALKVFDVTELKKIVYISDNEITIDIFISSDGNIENAQIEQSTGDPENDIKILNIISTWQFEPGEKSQKGKIKLKYFIK